MKGRKVIARKNLPAFPPINLTLVLIVLLKVFAAPGWVWGAVITVLVICWIGFIGCVIRDKEIDLFGRNP